ncbi:hypothetical protein Ntsu_68620 [Nocardia sp. IFM 10818]
MGSGFLPGTLVAVFNLPPLRSGGVRGLEVSIFPSLRARRSSSASLPRSDARSTQSKIETAPNPHS